MIANLLINGLVCGGIYALLAVGFSLIFGVAKIMNMAHTAFYMLCAFLLFIVGGKFGFPPVLSAVLAVIIACAVAMVCYICFIDRVRQHITAVMIITVALAMLFQEIFLLAFGGDFQIVPPFAPGFIEIANVRVPYQHLVGVGTSILSLSAIWFLLSKTMIGKAIRAVADDREIVNVMGINERWISMVTMGISVALAGIAAVVMAPMVMVHPLMWLQPLILILAAVMLGGLGSIKGAVIGALIMGFVETAVITLIPGGSFLRGAVSLCVMIMVLMIRPEGLFGVLFEEERL